MYWLLIKSNENFLWAILIEDKHISSYFLLFNFNMYSIPLHSSFDEYGFARYPFFLWIIISFKPVELKQTTGIPQDIASEAVWPKASSLDGTTIRSKQL